jgi:hypothetical protein
MSIGPWHSSSACSASLDQRRVLAALRHGAIGFIVKPFDAQSVLANIDGALALVISRNHAAAAGPSSAPPTAIPAGDRSSEQREFTRVTAALAVRVTPRTAVRCYLHRRSQRQRIANGLRLFSGNLALETGVEFRLELSAAEPPILGRARVARVDGDGRPALAFEEVSVADHKRLNAYIEQHTPPSQPRPEKAP